MYLRKAGRAGKRMYGGGNCTCGKREEPGSARTAAGNVPAESGKSRKAHVRRREMYLRKAGRARKRMYAGEKIPVDEFDLGTLSFTYGDSHKCILYA